jgi:hypothetical protein
MPFCSYVVGSRHFCSLARAAVYNYTILHTVLHLSQLRHYRHGIRLARGFLHRGIRDAHEDVVFLEGRALAFGAKKRSLQDSVTFSSPIVNLPCVSRLLSAYCWSVFTASVGATFTRNLQLPFVYSWPGCERQSAHSPCTVVAEIVRTNTFVPSGSFARTSLSAECICFASPSKNLPHPCRGERLRRRWFG